MSTHSPAKFTHREIVAMFPSLEALKDAERDLRSKGVDRTRLTMLGAGTDDEAAALRTAGFTSLHNLLEEADLPVEVFIRPEDAAVTRSMRISSSIYVADELGRKSARNTASAILNPIVAAAAAASSRGGSALEFLRYRLLDRPEPRAEASLAHGGLVLWVLLDNDELEVTPVLDKAGGEFLRIQDVPFERLFATQ
jgi:hypothetical protein